MYSNFYTPDLSSLSGLDAKQQVRLLKDIDILIGSFSAETLLIEQLICLQIFKLYIFFLGIRQCNVSVELCSNFCIQIKLLLSKNMSDFLRTSNTAFPSLQKSLFWEWRRLSYRNFEFIDLWTLKKWNKWGKKSFFLFIHFLKLFIYLSHITSVGQNRIF